MTGTTKGENLTLTWQRKGSEMSPLYCIFLGTQYYNSKKLYAILLPEAQN